MLRTDEIDDIRAALAGLAKTLPEYRERKAQRVMLGVVAKTLAAGTARQAGEQVDVSHLGAIECPTGTGKSSAVLPAIAIAMRRGKRVVVTSSTVALQEQLLHKDLPTLQRSFPYPFTFAVAKGRGRYVCLDKLSDEAGDDAAEKRQAKVIPIRPEVQTNEQVAGRLLAAYQAGTWNGEFESLTEQVDEATWERLTTDRHGCSGRRCFHYDNCAYYRAREQTKTSNVIVTNHSLLLAAIATGEDALLPALEDTLLIVDEAHHLPAKAVQQFAVRHTLRGSQTWVESIDAVVERSVHVCRLDTDLIKEAATLSTTLEDALGGFAEQLDADKSLTSKGTLRFKGAAIPPWIAGRGEVVKSSAQALIRILDKCRDEVKAAVGLDKKMTGRLLGKLGLPIGKLVSVVEAWDVLLKADDATPAARWIESFKGRSGRIDYAVCAAPVSAASTLQRQLWDKVCGAVSLSATLTGCGSFSLYLEESGIGRSGIATLRQLPSPFDYTNKACLVVPPMASDPKNAEAHTAEVTALLPTLITTRGTLVLWTSAKQMHEVYEAIPADLQRKVLLQGAMSKSQIIRQHAERVGAGQQSIIFGLNATFGEGIDLAGELLTHVILARVPFAVPDSPLEEARAEWIESQGRSSFDEYTLPQTGVKLAQAAGRLLRRETDWGTVTVLDKRLATTRWGRRLVSGLPPFRLVTGRTWREHLPRECEEGERSRRAA